ncbi:MAG: DUF1501 domain-containing protein, partial [Planctomycetaceae bacterium]
MTAHRDQAPVSPARGAALFQTRRQFFSTGGFSLGAVALGSLLDGAAPHPARARETTASGHDPAAGGARPASRHRAMLPPRAKRVIYLHMAGSPSQLDLFDYKPELNRLHLQDAPPSFLEGKRFAFIKGVPKVLAPQFAFAQQGQSGQWLSELWPHLSRVVDRLCLIRTVHTDLFNHAPAQLFVHTGSPRLGNASLGAWATYGLGSENDNLPGFVVLLSGGKTPDGGKSLWGSGFLPSVYQGVQCRTTDDPVLYLGDPRGIDRGLRRDMLDTLAEMNRAEFARGADPETLTRIAQYELAYRMQLAVPKVMNLAEEPEHILRLYGAQPGFVSPAES